MLSTTWLKLTVGSFGSAPTCFLRILRLVYAGFSTIFRHQFFRKFLGWIPDPEFLVPLVLIARSSVFGKNWKSFSVQVRNFIILPGQRALEEGIIFPLHEFAVVFQIRRFRLSIRMNDDHLLIILDRKETIVDIYFPVKVDYEKAEGKLMADERVLQILVPVVW